MSETEQTEQVEETVEIPLSVARDCADLCGFQARQHYSHNSTSWGDVYHSLARHLNDAIGDDWQEVGIERFEDAGERR